jgi:hypothetical protein
MQLLKKRNSSSDDEKNPQILESLEEGLDETKPSKPSFFRRIWNINSLMIFLMLSTCSRVGNVEGKINKLNVYDSQYPVLVQVGKEGKPILAQLARDGVLNDDNVEQYVAEWVSTVGDICLQLPKELGGGIEKGKSVPGIKQPVPTSVYMAASAIANQQEAVTWLAAHMQQAPQDLSRGACSSLQNINVSKPTGKGDSRTVTVTATRVITNPEGQPVMGGAWGRKITVIPAQRPRYITEPSPRQQMFNAFLARQLQIKLPIVDAREALP